MRKVEIFSDGVAICGDCTDLSVIGEVKKCLGDKMVNAVLTDPPYGNIVDETWDKWRNTQTSFVDWMIKWTKEYTTFLISGGAFYVWGGYGIPDFRPFFEYGIRVESETDLKISNFITWHKKRGYGVQKNFISTREEIYYMVKGDPKKPAVFNIPFLEKRLAPKYRSSSGFYRRTNVWDDVTELFTKRMHPSQKPKRVYEIPLEVSTNPDDWVLDPFAGSMTTAWAARSIGRKWICIEKDPTMFDVAVEALRNGVRKR